MAFSYSDSGMLFWVCRKHLLMLEYLGHFVSVTGFLLDWIFYPSIFTLGMKDTSYEQLLN